MRHLAKYLALAVILGLLPFACTEAPEPLQGPGAPASGLLTSALDGTEQLGDPSIPIAEGNRITAHGVGLRGGPSSIDFTLPAGVTVKQALVYWEGYNLTAVGDDQITVGGNAVTGVKIGGDPTLFFPDNWSSSYRADITSLGLVNPGANSISIAGMDFNKNNGAGIVVIYDDGTANVVAGIKDGNDLAYWNFDPPLDTTEWVEFTFDAFTAERTGSLVLIASSAEARPSVIEVDCGAGVQRLIDKFNDLDGAKWDTAIEPVTIPAGCSSVRVRILSERDGSSVLADTNPVSIAWLCAGLEVPLPLAALGDYVWYDDDRDGCQDASESAVNGVTVKLYSCENPSSPVLLETQTTGPPTFPAGEYFFDDLMPGDYFVEFSNLPTGYLFTTKDASGCDDLNDSDADPSTGRTICTTLDPGEIDRSWDAGIYTTSTFGDKVWLDGNCNGCQDADEPGIDGVTVKLYDCSTPSSPVLVATQVTASGGDYLFIDLMPGDYFAEFSNLPAGHAFTTPNACPQGDEKDSDADPSTGRTACTTLGPGENDLSWDAGLIELLSIGDYVWRDDDRDGCQGDTEPPVEGVVVYLWQGSSTIANTTTNAAGAYLFENLMPGSYMIQFVLPSSLSDHSFTVKDAACALGDEKDSDADPASGITDVIELVCGQDDLTIDAGIVPPVIGCRMTGGCNDTYDTGNGIEVYTCGGQAGAPLATQPQPWGEWTHTQKRGPSGTFTFHAGTASAPPGTEIDWIECMDPDWCRQARHAPAKQIDFAGVGTFKNIKNCPPEITDYAIVGETFHWFEVNVDDLGEPGKAGKVDPPAATCDPLGFGRNGGTQLADCECPDFYRITIHQGPTDSSPILYEVFGYIDGGNFQIHPLTGRDRKNVEDGGR